MNMIKDKSPEMYIPLQDCMVLEYLPMVVLSFTILGDEMGKSVCCLLVNALLLCEALHMSLLLFRNLQIAHFTQHLVDQLILSGSLPRVWV